MNATREKVLVVEDSRIDQVMFRRFAERETFAWDYDMADSVAAARKLLASETFVAVISDYLLGDGTAFNVMEWIGDLPLVIVTGSGNETVAVQALKAGAADYVIKDPSNNYLTALPATVEKAIRNNRTEKELAAHRRALEDRVRQQTASLQQEIRQKERVEAELRESQDRLRSLLRGMPLPVHIWQRRDDRFVFVDCNRRMEEVTSGKVRDYLGQTADRIFVGRDDILDDFETCFRDRAIVERETTYRFRATSEKMQVIVSYAFSPPDFVLVTFLDITDRKRLEAQLLQNRKMQAITTLVGGIAHEFNNLLSIIIGNTELAQEDLGGGRSVREYLNDILNAGLRARDVVRQLLDYSRGAPKDREPIQVEEDIVSTVRYLQASLPSGVTLRESIASDCRAVRANATEVQQVVYQLCSNAIAALENGPGEVGVAVRNTLLEGGSPEADPDIPGGHYLVVEVADSGCGIPAEDTDRIFDPYFTTREFGKGLGMGLSLVKGILNRLGAFIRVESRLGEGSVFRVYFPSVPPVEKPEPEPISGLPTGRERILLVDDEAPFTMVLAKMLERLGYRVESFVDPQKALETFGSDPERFDVVVSDVVMPSLTGDRLVERMKALRPGFPAVLMSGYNDRFDLSGRSGTQEGAVVRKPVDIGHLAHEIRKVLASSTGSGRP